MVIIVDFSGCVVIYVVYVVMMVYVGRCFVIGAVRVFVIGVLFFIGVVVHAVFYELCCICKIVIEVMFAKFLVG